MPEEWSKLVPDELFNVDFRPAPVRKLLKRKRRPLEPEKVKVLEAALRLSELVEWAIEKGTYDNHRNNLRDGTWPVRSVGLRWNAADRMHEPIDEYHDYAAQLGEVNHIVFLQPFALGRVARSAGSLESAIENLKAAIEMIGLVNIILRDMDGNSLPMSEDCKLINILGGEKDAN